MNNNGTNIKSSTFQIEIVNNIHDTFSRLMNTCECSCSVTSC